MPDFISECLIWVWTPWQQSLNFVLLGNGLPISLLQAPLRSLHQHAEI